MKLHAIGGNGSYAIVSSKGATVVSYMVGKYAVIYPQTGVGSKTRGGIPICFPFLGSPKEGFIYIPKHGWLRDEELTLVKEAADRLLFRGYTQKRVGFPWAIMYEVEVSIKGQDGSLTLSLKADRLKDGVGGLAPVNPAFHPYFSNLSGSKGVCTGTEVFQIVPFTDSREIPVCMTNLVDIGPKAVRMILAGDFNKNSRLNLWTDSDEYFCVEPMLTSRSVFATSNGKSLGQGESIKIECSLSIA